ncbi:restriction endonuclease subunit S [Chryseobacterium pennae]|uniref:restriction endonuclease subunit S n=1 Tax=Chryseobacterium pennae TaxID=2258962 RepID=UPI001E387EBC|nr:restriction endonuclease subunit S [Chryseobacterium pennae]
MSLKFPNLRFPGFEGQWEAKRLGEVATFAKGKGISKNEIVDDGETECIRYGELYTFYREVISEIKSKTNTAISTLVLSEANDVIIPASGETQIDIATASCVIKSGVALGGDLNIIKTKNNGVFLSYYLNSKKKLEIAKLSQGISVVHLYSSQLALLNLKLPQLEEQEKLSGFLSLLNSRIQTQKKIIEKLESLIQGWRERIFSQKVRFKNERNSFSSWEIKKLKDISIRITTKNIESNKNVLTISAQYGLISQLDFFSKSVSAKNIDNYYLLEKNDFAYNKSYSNGYPMGAIKQLINYKKGVVSTLYICFRFHDYINSEYMKHYFDSGYHNVEIEKIAQEGARNHGLLNISITDFFDIKISLPSREEQTKIANFLSSIQEKIETEKKIIEKLELQKKFLLTNLFV